MPLFSSSNFDLVIHLGSLFAQFGVSTECQLQVLLYLEPNTVSKSTANSSVQVAAERTIDTAVKTSSNIGDVSAKDTKVLHDRAALHSNFLLMAFGPEGLSAVRQRSRPWRGNQIPSRHDGDANTKIKYFSQ